ncbi:MAG TPA: hypothetical protein VFI22_05050 [Thermomicrobiales bacterium]|nr:hypothetical protein [Thermomicrobiales bacterium]
MRGIGIVAFCLSVLALAGVATNGLLAPAVFAQAATPPASPAATQAPAVVEVAATATAPAEAVVEATAAPQPAATQAAPATTDVVTLVAWYSNAPDNAFLNVVPIALTDDVAGPAPNGKAIGKVDFPEDGLPTITWGDTTFNAYLRFEGDVAERWTWFDDTEGARPATLVIQIEGTGGKYQGYFGTATFISRDDTAGGTLVLAIRPPRAEAAPAATPAT